MTTSSKPYNKKTGAEISASDYSHYVYGKAMPQHVALEEAVLGALMLDKNGIIVVGGILTTDAFYDDRHRLIYAAMLRLFERGSPMDLLLTIEELRKGGTLEAAGGPAYLAELTHRIASAANIEHHARIIMQAYLKRELIGHAASISKSAFEDMTDAFELLAQAEAGITSAANKVLKGQAADMFTVAKKYMERFDMLLNRVGGMTGIPTGLRDMDFLFGGLQLGDLHIIAARPAMGKTGLALKIAYGIAQAGIRVAVYSLEMDNIKLFNRLVSIDSGIGGTRLKDPKNLSSAERGVVRKSTEILSEKPIFIYDSLFDLMSIKIDIVRQAAAGAKVVIVDYIQLVENKIEGRNREQEVAGISRALKMLAQMLNIHVIALSQLSRAVETRGGTKRPQLSDLRESGAVEQDADIVSFIYRPEYYDIMEYEDGTSTKGMAEIIVAKHRNGPIDTLKFHFYENTVNFVSTDTYEPPRDYTDTDKHEMIWIENAEIVHPTPFQSPAIEGVVRGRKDDEDIPF